jgi:hypothetical protein
MQNTFSGGGEQFETQFMAQGNFINTDFKKTFFLYNLYSSQNFELPKSIFLEISGYYYSSDWAGMYKVKGFGTLNFGVKKELKNNGAIQLSVSDLLSSTHYRLDIDEPKTAYSITSKIDVMPESRKAPIIKFTYSKSFGNNKVKGQRQWSIGSKDERDRIRKD